MKNFGGKSLFWKINISWFQTFAFFWMSSSFLWGWSPCVWILCADVSEHSVSSIFIGGVSRKGKWDDIAKVHTQVKVWLNVAFRLAQAILSQTSTCTNTLAILPQLFFLITPPMKMEQTECSEMSAYKIQTRGNHPKERIQQIKICLGTQKW